MTQSTVLISRNKKIIEDSIGKETQDDGEKVMEDKKKVLEFLELESEYALLIKQYNNYNNKGDISKLSKGNLKLTKNFELTNQNSRQPQVMHVISVQKLALCK